MNTQQDIPIGLARQLLQRKFGKDCGLLDDLIFQHIASKSLLNHLLENNLVNEKEAKKLNLTIRRLEKIIKKRTNYLMRWYNAYLKLCSQCSECLFNEDGECSFYGHKEIPLPNPENPDKKCANFSSHEIPMHIKNIIN